MAERAPVKLYVGHAVALMPSDPLTRALTRFPSPALTIELDRYTLPNPANSKDADLALFVVDADTEYSQPWRTCFQATVRGLELGRVYCCGLHPGQDLGTWQLAGALCIPKRGWVRDPSDWIEVAAQLIVAAEKVAVCRRAARRNSALLAASGVAAAAAGAKTVHAVQQGQASRGDAKLDPIRRSLRVLLDQVTPTAADLDRLLLDEFRRAGREMSDGMDRTQRINLIFQHYSPLQVWEGLRRELHPRAEVERDRVLAALSLEQARALSALIRAHRSS